MVSVDEMTGIPALERAAPSRPMAPGRVQTREFEYIRQGTRAPIAGIHVATGKVYGEAGATQTEADFTRFLETPMTQEPNAKRRHFVVDNLNTHASIVRLVARHLGIDETKSGIKGKEGVLASLASRKAFLRDPTHWVVFQFTPKHASWLNQIEIWFSILVRTVIRRGNFSSLKDLHDKLLAFIDYFDRTMAEPFRWTYQDKPLTV